LGGSSFTFGLTVSNSFESLPKKTFKKTFKNFIQKINFPERTAFSSSSSDIISQKAASERLKITIFEESRIEEKNRITVNISKKKLI